MRRGTKKDYKVKYIKLELSTLMILMLTPIVIAVMCAKLYTNNAIQNYDEELGLELGNLIENIQTLGEVE